LPLRLAEFGSCFRNEPSGALHGLMRCRNFVQDDAHIFCTLEQVPGEIANFLDLLQEVYAVFGFHDITVKLATRPDQRVGDDSVWDQAEAALADVLNAKKWQWSTNPGEGAFYGPKIEFQLKDCLGRVWQCGTVQLDFNMPERLDATYIGEDSAKHTPIMIHRAILGSLERFIAILTENFAGHFPLWLAPQQIVIMTITDRQAAFAQEIMVSLQSCGLRVTADLRNEKIGYKIREHTIKRVPYLVVLGDQELAARELRVRLRDGTDLGLMNMEQFQARLLQEIRTKQLPNEPKQVEVGV
jgi:threonyl-tRNA synthetase